MPITRRPDYRIPALPKYVQIEPVGQCNLRCRMCAIRYRRDGPAAFMSSATFREIIDQFPGAVHLHLQGLGEPLMHPGFFEIVSFAVNQGLFVTTNSNMTLLDSARAEECVRSGLAWVRISLDGAHAETYESIRIGARLDQVLANIELLQSARLRLHSDNPRLFLVTVAMRKNVHELKDIVRLAAKLSIKELFVQHLCHDFSEEAPASDYAAMRQFVREETLLGEERGYLERHFNQAREAARELGVDLRLPAIANEEQQRKKGRGRCDWPWTGIYISYDGRVMPCCMIGTPDRIHFGSITAESVGRIWNKKAYRDFRAALDSDAPPSLCRACAIYQGIF